MTDSCRLDVDHVGILASSIDGLVGCYRKLGFRVIGPADLKAVDEGENIRPLGQQSAHIMFADTYIELTAVSAPSPGHHLSAFLDGPDGLRLLILRATDVESSRQRCADAGLDPGPIQKASREIAYGNAGTARFRWFALPVRKYPEALFCFVQHDTFETVFQPEVASHENRATGLSRIILAGDSVPGRYLALDTDGNGTVMESRPSEALDALFGAGISGCPPLAGLGIAVADIEATRRFLSGNGIPHQLVDRALAIAPAHAGGVGLLFETPSSRRDS